MTTILIVEDTKDLAQVIAKELEAAGFDTRTVYTGGEALPAFHSARPDLVVLDWMLAGMDGLEILRRLRMELAVPVLMLTARGDEADRVIGLEVGADDYLTKPFGLRELVARVRALLRRAERIQEQLAADQSKMRSVLRYEGLELDPEGYLALLADRPLELTRTEFDLLHLFLRNQGRTFSRTYLLDTVWGASFVEGDRSVDNAVLRLRKKLGALGDCIETVWGVGYRWRRA